MTALAALFGITALEPPLPGEERLYPDVDALMREEFTSMPLRFPYGEDGEFALEFALDHSGRVSGYWTRALDNSHGLLPRVVNELRLAGLPVELAALPLLESAYDPRALSPAGALGLWQIMPRTARKLGLDVSMFVDERLSPERATDGAIALLKELYGRYGDWWLSLAGYNAGSGRVDEALYYASDSIRKPKALGRAIENVRMAEKVKESRAKIFKSIPRKDMYRAWVDSGNIWDYCEAYEFLPRETELFVPRFLTGLYLLTCPDDFGYPTRSFIGLRPPDADTFYAETPLDLFLAAKLLGEKTETLLELNPQLTFGITPPETTYPVALPPGKAAVLTEKLKARKPVKVSVFGHHKVKKGESLAKIAGRYGVKAATLAKANGLPPGAKPKTGKRLLIPVEYTAYSTRHTIREEVVER